MPVVALIEDDPMVRGPLARGLDDAGYQVVVAASGPEALALLEGHAIDVAVVDVILPGLVDGGRIVREARRHNPGITVILTSGKPLPDDLVGLAPFVPKPLRLGALLARVRRAIAGDDLTEDQDLLASVERIVDEFGALAMFYATMRADDGHDRGDHAAVRHWTRILQTLARFHTPEPSTGH